MLQSTHRSAPGAINSSLDFIVTSFLIPKGDLHQLPDWLQAEIPPLQARKSRLDRIFEKVATGQRLVRDSSSQNLDFDFFDPNPSYFIGEAESRVTGVTAPKLPRQLAELGIIPVRRKIYLKDFKYGDPRYMINMYWQHRGASHDTDEMSLDIAQSQEFFFEWCCGNTWDVKGIEFNTLTRALVLDFRRRRPTPPSQRQFEVMIEDDCIQAIGLAKHW